MDAKLYSRICQRIDSESYYCHIAHNDLVQLLESYRRLARVNKVLRQKIHSRIETGFKTIELILGEEVVPPNEEREK